MSKRHEEQIREQWVYIADTMNSARLTGALFTSRVLTKEDKELIDLQQLERQKNEKMLDIIYKKPDWTYQQFIKDLKKTQQPHIAKVLQIPGLYTNDF